MAKPSIDEPGQRSPTNALSGETLIEAAEFALRLVPCQRVIGLDLGTKTIGIALSDVTRTIASPLMTIVRKKFKADANSLLELAGKHAIAGFVLGFPRNLNGSEGPRAQATRAFARNLNALSPLPILLWDERLSTVAAERALLEADASRKRRSELINHVAASIILQSSLDRLKTIRADE